MAMEISRRWVTTRLRLCFCLSCCAAALRAANTTLSLLRRTGGGRARSAAAAPHTGKPLAAPALPLPRPTRRCVCATCARRAGAPGVRLDNADHSHGSRRDQSPRAVSGCATCRCAPHRVDPRPRSPTTSSLTEVVLTDVSRIPPPAASSESRAADRYPLPSAAAMMLAAVALSRGNSAAIVPACMTATRSLIPRISGSSEEIIRIAMPRSARSCIRL